MKRPARTLLLLTLLLAPGVAEAAPVPLRVLFIGNS